MGGEWESSWERRLLLMLRDCRARPRAEVDDDGTTSLSGWCRGAGRAKSRAAVFVMGSRGGFAAMVATRLVIAVLATCECLVVLP